MDMRDSSQQAKRGFVTIATGKDKYYDMAVNLLRSYRQNSSDSAPFALICDRDCPQAREFDSFVLLETAHRSYVDKLFLVQNTPFEETIFIDADCLILRDTQPLWEDFAEMTDFSCYGKVLPLDSRRGWFFYEDMGDLQPQLHYNVNFHGGLYYMRKTPHCAEVFEKALDFARNYSSYPFSGFDKPADEPVLALAMALSGMKPCQDHGLITFLLSHEPYLRMDENGTLLMKGKPAPTIILHFGNVNVERFLYQYILKTVEYHRGGGEGALPKEERRLLQKKYRTREIQRKCFWVVRKAAMRFLPAKVLVQLKKMLR